MKCLRANRAIALALTIILTTLLISPAYAASVSKGDAKKTDTTSQKPLDRKGLKESIKNRDNRQEFSADELEQMRSSLFAVLDASRTLYSTFTMANKGETKGDNDNLASEFEATRQQIEKMSGQDLAVYRKVLDPSAIQTKIANSVRKINAFRNQNGMLGAVSLNTPTLPGITYYCNGSTPITPMPTAPVDPGTLSASDDIYFIAEGIRDLAQNACNQVAVVVVLGEGGGANTRLLCNISDAVYLVAKIVNQKLHFCDNDYAASTVAANYDRLGHIHTDLASSVANDNSNEAAIVANDNANKTTIINNDNGNRDTIVNNDNANKTTIVNNDNANRVTIVNNDNANAFALTNLVNAALTQIITNANANKDETKNLLLRTQIEADLSSTDGSVFVALYETPVTVCFSSLNSLGLPQAGVPSSTVQCGLLDLVRSIVSQTIANVGAGTNAQSFFVTGDAQRAAGKYKLAYSSYRQAYKAASK